MQAFEYMAIPAPIRGTKAKGLKSTADRFALSLTDAINQMAAEGWDYVRAETLPCEERKGLSRTQKSFQNVLIFRRRVQSVGGTAPAPLSLETPVPVEQPAQAAAPLRREPRLTSAPTSDVSQS